MPSNLSHNDDFSGRSIELETGDVRFDKEPKTEAAVVAEASSGLHASPGVPDSRYPYTYADDFVRAIPEPTSQGCKLSRSEASQIIHAIADAIGWRHETLAARIADAQLAKSEETVTNNAQRMIAALRGSF